MIDPKAPRPVPSPKSFAARPVQSLSGAAISPQGKPSAASALPFIGVLGSAQPSSSALAPHPFASGLSSPALAPSPFGPDGATGALGPEPPPRPMPLELQQYMQKLELWALANKKDARLDSLKFWSLKGPAIVAASLSGVLASLHLPSAIPLLIGVIGSICVAFDGIVHPGKMRSFHIRAVHDLRTLEHSIQNQWIIASLRHVDSEEFAAKLLENAEQKRLEISEYLKDGEGQMPETHSSEAKG